MQDFTAYLRLGVDSRDAVNAQRDLDGMAESGDNAEKSFNSLGSSAKLLGGAIASIGLGAAAAKVLEYSDAWTNVENTLVGVTDSQAALLITQAKVIQLAKDTNSSLDATAGLYAAITRSTGDLGVSQERVIGVTRTINNLFLAGGKSAEEAAGAITQLNQGLSAGALRGDEFNSVAEGAPQILDAISQSLGKTRGELRAFAATGGITSEILVAALEGYSDEAQRLVDTTQRTFGQSVELARTFALEFVAGSESISGVSSTVADVSAKAGQALVLFAQNLDLVADAVGAVALVMTVKLAAALATTAQGQLAAVAASRALAVAENDAAVGAARRAVVEAEAAKAALVKARADNTAAVAAVSLARANGTVTQSVGPLIAALNAQATAQQRLSSTVAATAAATNAANVANARLAQTQAAVAGTGALATAMKGLGAAMGFLGGPVGVAVLAGAAIYYFATRASEAEKIVDTLGVSVEEVTSKFQAMGVAQQVLARQEYRRQIEEQQELIDGLSGKLQTLRGIRDAVASSDEGFLFSKEGELQDAEQDILEVSAAIESATDKLNRLKEVSGSVALPKEQVADFVDSLSNVDRILGLLPNSFSMVEQAAFSMFDKSAFGAKATSEEYKKLSADIERQIALFGDSSKSAELSYDLRTGALKNLSDSEAEALIQRYKVLESLDAQKKKTEDLAAAEKSRADGVAATIQQMEKEAALIGNTSKYAEALYDIEKGIVKVSAAEKERYLNAAKAADVAAQTAKDQQEYVSAYKKWVEEQRTAEKKTMQFSEDAAERIGNAFASMWANLGGGAEAVLDNLASAFKQTLAEMAHEAITKPIILNVQQAVSGGGNAGAGGGGGGLLAGVGAAGVWGLAAAGIAAAVSSFNKKQDEAVSKMTAAYKQSTQSLGTVLGESSRKSESIANAIARLGETSADALDVNHQMYQALLDIREGIGGVAAGFARQFNIEGGIGDFSGITGTQNLKRIGEHRDIQNIESRINKIMSFGNNDIAEFVGGFAKGIMDGINKNIYSKKTKIIDTGIGLAAQTLSDILAGGTVDAFAYAVVNTKKKVLGVTTGNTTKTLQDELDNVLLEQFSGVFESAGRALEQVAPIFGKDFAALLPKLIIDPMKLSLKGLEGDALVQEIEAFFSSTLDVWAGVLVEGSSVLEKFQKVGEGAFETVVRLASELNTFNYYADALNLSFDLVGFAAVDAQQNILQLAGGVESLTSSLSGYYSNFFSESERAAQMTARLTEELAEMGIDVMPASREAFRQLVEGIDLSTEAGQKQFAGLINLQGIFADLVPAVDSASKSLKELQESAAETALAGLDRAVAAQRTVLDKQIGIIEDSLSTSRSVFSALESALNGMVVSSARTQAATRRQAQAELSGMLAQARSGRLPDIRDLNSALSVIAHPSENLYSTFSDYILDFDRTAADIKALQDVTGEQVSTEEHALSELQQQTAFLDEVSKWAKEQVDELKGVSTNVQSVADALMGLTGVLGVSYPSSDQQTVLAQMAVAAEQSRVETRQTSTTLIDLAAVQQKQAQDFHTFVQASQLAISENTRYILRLLEKFDEIGIPIRDETITALAEAIAP